MKILIIHNEYQQRTGEHLAVQAQISLLRQKGHSLHLYFRDSTETQSYNLRQKVSFFLKTVFNPSTKKDILSLVGNEKPDIAHVHNVFPLISPSVYLALKQMGIPIVQTIYNFRLMCSNGTFYTQGRICERCKMGNTLHAIQHKCFHNSHVLSALYAFTIAFHRRIGTFSMIDQFAVPARFTAQKLVEGQIANWNKITLLPLFLPDPLPEPAVNTPDKSYFIYVGRLTAEKGILTLVKAFAGLPEYQLKIVGGGPLTEIIRNQIEQERIPNIELVGYVWGQDKWNLLRNATASIIPSEWYENSPYSMLDSLAIGTPVIATNLGSLADIIEHQKNGVLFIPGDHEDLRRQVSWLAESPAQRSSLSYFGRQLIEVNHSAKTHYKTLIQMYTDLISYLQ